MSGRNHVLISGFRTPNPVQYSRLSQPTHHVPRWTQTHGRQTAEAPLASSLTRPPWSYLVRVAEMPRCYGYTQTPAALRLPAMPRPLWQQPCFHSPNRKRKLREPCASTHELSREPLEQGNRDPTAITGLAGSAGNGPAGNPHPGWERRAFCGLWSGGEHGPTGTRVPLD